MPTLTRGDTHAYVWIEGIVSDEEGEECFLQSMAGTRITVRADNQKKCRTFQDTSMSYQEVMEQILADVPDVKLHFHVEDKSIEMPNRKVESVSRADN